MSNNGKKEKNRVTKIEKERRLFIIQGWIIEGIQDNLIVKNIVEKTDWGIDVRQAQRYVRDAYLSWQKIQGIKIDAKREMKIARLQQLTKSLGEEYRKTPSGLRTILAIEKEITKLEGINLPKKIQIQEALPPLEIKVITADDVRTPKASS
ncbi:hypothetical protein [Flavobacterium sp.]|jgi:hypothetical protein|uniref:hypothetical protein n=1 Tax=Flavobacterium sp. TaxID=239 RepID=UPI0022C92F40|nr:hypothetical protein [Flavobacterium sp.]MCZ8144877.1 hypothetical protein [Flavobacterium sp.]